MTRTTRTIHFLIAACGSALAAPGAFGQCQSPQWTNEFTAPATAVGPGQVYSVQVFDADGPGPLPAELYIGGTFQIAGGVPALRIARWNGSSWSSVGGGITGTNSVVTAMGLHDPDGDGPEPAVLVVAGVFGNAGGTGATRLATWNGSAWGTLGTPPLWWGPTAITTFDPDGAGPVPSRLVVATQGFEIEPWITRGLALWDGQNWSWPATEPGYAEAIAVYDGDGPGPQPARLYIALHDAPGVSSWDGTNWMNVGGGLSRSMPYLCTSLRVVDLDGPGPGRPVLLAGGSFTHAGGAPAPNVARWDGAEWTPMGNGVGTDVTDILVLDNTQQPDRPYLYAVGSYRLARWNPDGQSWQTVSDLESFSWPFPPFQRLAAFRGSGTTESIYMSGNSTITGQPAQGSLRRLTCEGQACYANCDGSTGSPALTANDFQCFLNAFANGSAYANCDGSTGAPVLTANDFQCFLNKYAAGCT